jgi:hypothetical protein
MSERGGGVVDYFGPCERYRPIPPGCSICVHAILDDPPCQALTEAVLSNAYPEVICCQPPDPNPTPCAAAATLEV